MPDYQFSNLLESNDVYDRAEAYWFQVWSQVDPMSRKFYQWRAPWITTTFGDGSPMRDGNPIFSAVSHAKLKGIRIIQHAPGEGYDLDVWLENGLNDGEISEMVIDCALSDVTAVTVFSLMSSWVKGDIMIDYRQNRIVPSTPSLSITPQIA